MTPKKNTNGPHFTSFRILGEKAQKLLAKARAIQNDPGSPRQVRTVDEGEPLPELLVHISLASVVKATFAILAIIVGAILLWLLQDKIVLLLLSVFIAMIIDPGVKFLRRLGVPRGLGVLLHFFVAIFLFIFLIVSFIPLIASQIVDLAGMINVQANEFLQHPQIAMPFLSQTANANLTQFLQTMLQNLSITHFADALGQFGQSLAETTQNSLLLAAQLAGSVVNFFVNATVILVLAFFVQIEKEKIVAWLKSFLPWNMRSYLDDKSMAIQTKMAQWARGQLILCLSIGCLVFLALTILQVPYALTLAILAAVTEFIPVVGPIFAAIPTVLIASVQQGLGWGLIIVGVYYVIQWCENNLLVPLIMKRAVGLSPLVIMFAMMVSISFPTIIHPVLGVILSIPTTTILALFLEDWRLRHPRRKATA